jgi:hypothetical protein
MRGGLSDAVALTLSFTQTSPRNWSTSGHPFRRTDRPSTSKCRLPAIVVGVRRGLERIETGGPHRGGHFNEQNASHYSAHFNILTPPAARKATARRTSAVTPSTIKPSAVTARGVSTILAANLDSASSVMVTTCGRVNLCGRGGAGNPSALYLTPFKCPARVSPDVTKPAAIALLRCSSDACSKSLRVWSLG